MSLFNIWQVSLFWCRSNIFYSSSEHSYNNKEMSLSTLDTHPCCTLWHKAPELHGQHPQERDHKLTKYQHSCSEEQMEWKPSWHCTCVSFVNMTYQPLSWSCAVGIKWKILASYWTQTFITDMTAPIKLGPKHKNKETTGKGWEADQFSES